MNSLAQRRRCSLVGLGVVALLVACHEEVPLGAWKPQVTSASGLGGTGPGSSTVTSAGTLTGAGAGGGTSTSTSTDGGGTGSAAGATGDPGLPACLAAGVPGPLNTAGPGVPYPTEMATEWTWPAPVASMEWDLMVEREIVRQPPDAERPSTGYYWAHQFYFEEGVTGFLGIQAEGGYSEKELELGETYEWTKMAVFWLSGPPLDAELGDIPFPDARILPDEAAGVNYWTIHAKFDWQVCHTYHFRIGPHATDPDGSTWYGAWIEDKDTGVGTFLGRMRLPAGSGQLSVSRSRSMHIDFVPADELTCDIPAHASALFGTPRANDGAVLPVLYQDNFAERGCPSSRYTRFDAAVRHEMGVPAE